MKWYARHVFSLVCHTPEVILFKAVATLYAMVRTTLVLIGLFSIGIRVIENGDPCSSTSTVGQLSASFTTAFKRDKPILVINQVKQDVNYKIYTNH